MITPGPGAAFVLGRRAIHDVPTAVIAALGFAVFWRFTSVPEPALIVLAGMVGLLIGRFRV